MEACLALASTLAQAAAATHLCFAYCQLPKTDMLAVAQAMLAAGSVKELSVIGQGECDKHFGTLILSACSELWRRQKGTIALSALRLSSCALSDEDIHKIVRIAF